MSRRELTETEQQEASELLQARDQRRLSWRGQRRLRYLQAICRHRWEVEHVHTYYFHRTCKVCGFEDSIETNLELLEE